MCAVQLLSPRRPLKSDPASHESEAAIIAAL